jgi:hypothetical protein
MLPQPDQQGFDFDAFGQALGWKPWPYSPKGTYWDDGGRFIDDGTKTRFAGFVHGILLLSEYDADQGRNVLYPFPWPKSVDEALAALVAIGWWVDTVEHRSAFLKKYANSADADGPLGRAPGQGHGGRRAVHRSP